MATKDTPDSTAASPAEAQAMQCIEDLLIQCNHEETMSIRRRVVTACSHRSQALNRQTSPLLKLPTELILDIGKLVLDVRGNELIRDELLYLDCSFDEQYWGKGWFAQALPFLQTCNQLRNQLHPLRFESVPLRPRLYGWGRGITGLWYRCAHDLAKWSPDGPHKGMKTLHLGYPLDGTLPNLSTAAASAGSLECMIYGRLMNPPVVYWNCLALDPSWDDEDIREDLRDGSLLCFNEFEVNHSREQNMWASYDNRSCRLLGDEEATVIWALSKRFGRA